MKHYMSFALLTGVVLMSIFAGGCRKSTPDLPVRQNYDVIFDEYGRTSATAYFTAGADNRPVVFPGIAQVTANGIVRNGLAPTPRGGFSWELDTAAEVVFAFNSRNGVLTNRVNKSVFDNIEIVGDTVFSASDTIRVSWTGGGISPEYEYVSFSLVRLDDGSGVASATTSGVQNGREFVFDYNATSSFYPGVYHLNMYVTKSLSLQQSDDGAGGAMHASLYLSKVVRIQ